MSKLTEVLHTYHAVHIFQIDELQYLFQWFIV
jgi:hypothetical protein